VFSELRRRCGTHGSLSMRLINADFDADADLDFD